MKYNELKVSKHQTSKRLGRGIGSGKGKTAGRGTKGQRARTGSSIRPGFTGGQNPIMQRLPKLPGFTNLRPKAMTIYVGQLEQFSGKTVDNQFLFEHGLVPNAFSNIKVITGKDQLSKKVTVRLQAASASAVASIQKAGGTFEVIDRPKRPISKTDKK